MSSRVLGEDTEDTREQVEIGVADGEYIPVIKCDRCEANEEFLKRSVIGIASSSLNSQNILDCILAEGVTCLDIKPMAGMMHLITFETLEDKDAHLESNWLSTWFLKMQDVNKNSASLWRETWLTIHGVPLTAWTHGNFYKIGCIYGRVLSVDYSGYECVKILIYTDCLFKINNQLLFDIEDKRYTIFVSENINPDPPIIPPCQKLHNQTCSLVPMMMNPAADTEHKVMQDDDDVEHKVIQDDESSDPTAGRKPFQIPTTCVEPIIKS